MSLLLHENATVGIVECYHESVEHIFKQLGYVEATTLHLHTSLSTTLNGFTVVVALLCAQSLFKRTISD